MYWYLSCCSYYFPAMKFKNKQICSIYSIFLIVCLLAPLGCRGWKYESEKLKEEITDVSSENKKLRKELDNLKTENANMHGRLGQLNLQMAEFQKEVQNLKKELESFKAQVKRAAQKSK